ncbi:MAG: hydroxymethylbilane synthase [Pseudomonadota bacterium]
MTSFKIGTRGSPLALAQANMVKDALEAGGHEGPLEIVIIKTEGDRILDRPLSEVGGKGLFVKEIEEALIAGRIDCAVHSAKDLETSLPDGLTLGAFLPREDVRDAFIGKGGAQLADLPAGATVGTASLRRQALVRRARPDLLCKVLRGNVQTRLAKLEAGDCDATLLALAGLKRLGNTGVATELLPLDQFPPAVAQGAIAIEVRRDDPVAAPVAALDDAPTRIAVTAERGFLAALDGSCRTPIAGLATVDGGTVRLSGLVANHDGSDTREVDGKGAAADAAAMGYDAGERLRARLPAGFL